MLNWTSGSQDKSWDRSNIFCHLSLSIFLKILLRKCSEINKCLCRQRAEMMTNHSSSAWYLFIHTCSVLTSEDARQMTLKNNFTQAQLRGVLGDYRALNGRHSVQPYIVENNLQSKKELGSFFRVEIVNFLKKVSKIYIWHFFCVFLCMQYHAKYIYIFLKDMTKVNLFFLEKYTPL